MLKEELERRLRIQTNTCDRLSEDIVQLLKQSSSKNAIVQSLVEQKSDLQSDIKVLTGQIHSLINEKESIGNMHTAEVDANCILKDQNDHFRAMLTAIGISATATSKLEGE